MWNPVVLCGLLVMEFLQVGNLLDRGTRTLVSPLGLQLKQASLRRAAVREQTAAHVEAEQWPTQLLHD